LNPTPNLEDQIPVFMSPSDMVAQLYSQALGSLSVAIYDSQGYGGGIITRLHTGTVLLYNCLNLHYLAASVKPIKQIKLTLDNS
jgi:hypothetical protein